MSGSKTNWVKRIGCIWGIGEAAISIIVIANLQNCENPSPVDYVELKCVPFGKVIALALICKSVACLLYVIGTVQVGGR